MTNFERIKSLDLESLAEFLQLFSIKVQEKKKDSENCKDCFLREPCDKQLYCNNVVKEFLEDDSMI